MKWSELEWDNEGLDALDACLRERARARRGAAGRKALDARVAMRAAEEAVRDAEEAYRVEAARSERWA